MSAIKHCRLLIPTPRVYHNLGRHRSGTDSSTSLLGIRHPSKKEGKKMGFLETRGAGARDPSRWLRSTFFVDFGITTQNKRECTLRCTQVKRGVGSAHCKSLQHTATHCNTLQHTATHCNTHQHSVTHVNTLENTATHCNTLQHT